MAVTHLAVVVPAMSVGWTAQAAWPIILHGARWVGMRSLSPNAVPPI